jgi:hypothetical protein
LGHHDITADGSRYSRKKKGEHMSDRKLHMSLTEEHFQAARKCAFDAETSISHVIGHLVHVKPFARLLRSCCSVGPLPDLAIPFAYLLS